MQNFVAVFDSGVGGLNVLLELQKVAPFCDFMYLADHAFCPYGTKSVEQLKSRVTRIACFLKSLGANSVVVACNTASQFAPSLRKLLSLPVFDVIYPTCCAIFEHTYCRKCELGQLGTFAQRTLNAQMRSRKIALLATDSTVKSRVYSRVLSCFGVQTTPFCCSALVPLAENCAPQSACLQVVKTCLTNFQPDAFDAVVLGCTHFPLLQQEISQFTGNVPIISSALPVAKFFAKSNLPKSNGHGRTLFFTTGNVEGANKAAHWCGATFSHIDLPTQL